MFPIWLAIIVILKSSVDYDIASFKQCNLLNGYVFEKNLDLNIVVTTVDIS